MDEPDDPLPQHREAMAVPGAARVGYQGVPACYSDLAIRKMFSTRDVSRLERVGFRGFAAVLDALESKQVDEQRRPL